MKTKSMIYLANIGEGTHDFGRLTKRTDAAITTRHLLMKKGTDDDHVALCGAGEVALGVCQDEADGAERAVAVHCLPCAGRTMKVVTDGAGALAISDFVTTAANGKVAKVAAAVGNKYIVGQVLNTVPATDGEIVIIAPIGGFINTAVS